VLTLADQIL